MIDGCDDNRRVDSDLGAFLKGRRARLSPEQVGLPIRIGRTRVSGLRREDVAALASVSVDYYTRLEQGRAGAVSDAVLDAVARALRMNQIEREHLGRLARPRRAAPPATEPSLGGEYVLLLHALRDVPALAIDAAMDILAVNELAREVFGIDLSNEVRPNAARLAFAVSSVSGRIRNREDVAAAALAHLRYESGRRPTEPRIAALVDELSRASEEFRRLWEQQDVRGASSIEITVEHPAVGVLELQNLWLAAPLQPDITVIVYLARQGSETARKLADLPAVPTDPLCSVDQFAACTGSGDVARMRIASDAARNPRSTAAL